MKIFISWSKARSKMVADGLADLIGAVVKGAEPWVSFRRLSGGEEFVPRLHKSLAGTQFAIICVTEETRESPWIFYELGLLRRKGVKVCPYLVDLKMAHSRLPVQLPERLSRRADEQETLELMKDIKRRMVRRLSKRDNTEIEETFHQHWPAFELVLLKARLHTVEDAFKFCRERVNDVIALGQNLKKYVDQLKLAMWAVVPLAVEIYDSRREEIKGRIRESDPAFKKLINQIHQLVWDGIEEVKKNFIERHNVVGDVRKFLNVNYKPEELRAFLVRVAKTFGDYSDSKTREELLKKEVMIEISRVFFRFQQEVAKCLLTSMQL